MFERDNLSQIAYLKAKRAHKKINIVEEETLKDLKFKIDIAMTQLENLYNYKDQINRDMSYLDSQIFSTNKEIENIKTTLSNFETRIATLESKVK